jgi:hypothetical protein
MFLRISARRELPEGESGLIPRLGADSSGHVVEQFSISIRTRPSLLNQESRMNSQETHCGIVSAQTQELNSE